MLQYDWYFSFITSFLIADNLTRWDETNFSKNEFAVMRETLTMKQEELEKSKMTAEELAREEAKLRDNVRKVEELEEKIRNETVNLRQQVQEMKQDMKVLADLDTLREAARAKREEVAQQREALITRKVRPIR